MLDSFAVVCFFARQRGWEDVRARLREEASARRKALLSLINLGECYYVAALRAGAERARHLVQLLDRMPVEVVGVDRPLALRAAEIKADYPISYADAFCVATAEAREARVMTGDPEFKSVEELVDVEWLPGNR
ncbi:MAG: type II toxin-antitoxin system VapC family toxin [Myxococcales bacterium]|nr:type II toxin-antitoxin system VapC family toxin [Myxococcales bacterium]